MKLVLLFYLFCFSFAKNEEATISDAELNELLKDPKYASMAAELKSLENGNILNNFRSKSG
jgi:hypothetical protein